MNPGPFRTESHRWAGVLSWEGVSGVTPEEPPDPETDQTRADQTGEQPDQTGVPVTMSVDGGQSTL